MVEPAKRRKALSDWMFGHGKTRGHEGAGSGGSRNLSPACVRAPGAGAERRPGGRGARRCGVHGVRLAATMATGRSRRSAFDRESRSRLPAVGLPIGAAETGVVARAQSPRILDG